VNQVLKEIYLNLDKSNNILPIVTAKQGDNAREVIVNLLNGSTIYTIAVTTTAKIAIKKPDGTQILNDCSISNNKIYVPLTIQTLAASGQAIAEIKLIDSSDNTFLSTPIFLLKIEPSSLNASGVESSNEFTTLENALLTVGSIENKLDKTGDASDTTVAFTAATTEADIITGEKQSTILGKILKSISTFRTGKINVSQIINNLAATVAGNVLDATQGKVLKDSIDAINTNLTCVSFTPTLNFTQGSTPICYKQNNKVSIQLHFSNVSISNGTTVATLPTGYRPTTTTDYIRCGVAYTGSSFTGTIPIYAIVFSTGVVKIYNDSAVAMYMAGINLDFFI